MTSAAYAQQRQTPFRWLKTATVWTVSIVLAVWLNLALFSLMPRLIRSGPIEKKEYEDLRSVDFIRFEKKETPPERKKKEKPPEKKPLEQTQTVKKAVSRPRPQINRTVIPYELNPRLPAGQIQLPSLDMKTMSVDAPAMKDFYDAGELDGPLAALVRTPPIYPLTAKRRGIEGWVKVRFLVTETGRVERFTVLESQPELVFDRAVERCVLSWRFNPGTVEGEPVKAWAETVVRFELQ